MFEKVTRKQAKLRMALMGVSGSGKTLGALYIAYGITGDWSKIALIDTEHERGRFYAARTDLGTGAFMYATLNPPYTPEKYKALVKEAADLVGTDGVVVVDSFSHAWSNEGGILDIKDRIAAQAGKNSYTAWNEAGKEQNKLVNVILAVDCHTIITLRSKMDYVLETNDKGRQTPVKVGLAPVQRDDTEYEFDIVLDIGRNHIATASKDTTFLDKYGEIITPKLGQQLRAWLDEGEKRELVTETPREEIKVRLVTGYIPPEQIKAASAEAIAEGPKPTVYICESCTKPVRSIKTATNEYTAEQVAKMTAEKCGRQLCWDCAAKEAKGKKAAAKLNAAK